MTADEVPAMSGALGKYGSAVSCLWLDDSTSDLNLVRRLLMGFCCHQSIGHSLDEGAKCVWGGRGVQGGGLKGGGGGGLIGLKEHDGQQGEKPKLVLLHLIMSEICHDQVSVLAAHASSWRGAADVAPGPADAPPGPPSIQQYQQL